MNTRKTIICGLFAVALALAFTACEQPTDSTATLTGITAVYTPISATVYPTTPLDNLKAGLTVTANYSDNTSNTLNAADYTLSGNLTVPASTITVTYQGKTDTFTVTVTAARAEPNNDITYTATQSGGADKTEDSNGADSTGIVFTFSASVDSLNLTTANINVGEAAAKGANVTLTGTGTTRTLSITVTHAGQATVTITKPGIEAGTKHVTVYKEGESPPTLTGITADYTGTATIYPATPLNDLKTGLTVKAQYIDDSEETLSENEYDLSVSGNTLIVGPNTITVTYQGKEANFPVTVADPSVPVSLAAITGVTPPVTLAMPVTAITATAQYTGTVGWTPDDFNANGSFKGGVAYTAVITLIPEDGYTLHGVAANFFTVAGVNAANAADSGVITAVFPAPAPLPFTGTVSITANGSPVAAVLVNTELTANYSETATTVEYQWNKDGTPIAAGGNSAAYTPASTGTYTVTVGNADSNYTGNAITGGPVTVANFIVTNSAEWTSAKTAISDSAAGNYVIYINATTDIEIAGASTTNTTGNGTFGAAAHTVTLKGSGTLAMTSTTQGNLIRVTAGQKLIIDGEVDNGEDLLVLKGRAGNNAALLFFTGTSANPATLQLENGKITGNANPSGNGNGANGTTSGGGVYLTTYALFTMNGGTISGNASTNGGGVYLNAADVQFTMSGGTISDNTTSSAGGGVYLNNGPLFTMNGGIINGNTSGSSGGGVAVSGGNSRFTISEGTISGNTGTTGGGVWVSGIGAQLTMNGGTISTNTATGTGSGGGVAVARGSFTMTDGIINNNTTSGTGSGGGVAISGSNSISFTLSGGYIRDNTTGGAGGGVYLTGTNSFTMSGGIISGNTANSTVSLMGGGGVYVGNNNSFTKTSGLISSNNASALNRGHSVLYINSSVGYYNSNELTEIDDISTSDTLPTASGQTAGKWTRQ